MPKTIAIDFGLKRTGLAITDENCIFAFGHETVESRNLMVYLENGSKKRMSTPSCSANQSV